MIQDQRAKRTYVKIDLFCIKLISRPVFLSHLCDQGFPFHLHHQGLPVHHHARVQGWGRDDRSDLDEEENRGGGGGGEGGGGESKEEIEKEKGGGVGARKRSKN